MNAKFDWITAMLAILLLAVLIGFFTGAFPYPYGWIIITGLLILRVKQLSKPDG